MSEKKPGKKKSENSGEEKREEVINKIESNIEKSEEDDEKEEHVSRKVVIMENKTFMIILAIILLIVAAFVSYLLFSNNAKTFTYDGVTYTITPMGKLTFYDTKIPTLYNGKILPYNLFLRNNPKTLNSEVPFNGTLYIRPYLVMNYSNNIDCNGVGVISIQNMINLYKNALNVTIVKDPNATCDPQLRYVYVSIIPSNKTDVQQIAPGCYDINVNNCQVIKATERYLTESLALLKQINYSA